MKIIKSNDTLLTYMPNVVVSVSGEQTLFDKVRQHLIAAEQWVEDTFTSAATLTRIAEYSDSMSLKHAVATCIVSEAMARAVPSLDLVLTPNGFGIVSSQSVAPASKERVERLIASLIENRDKSLETMLRHLPDAHAWTSSEQCRYFTKTVFPDFSLLAMLGVAERRWERYQELRAQLITIEGDLADRFFSPQLVALWHDITYQGDKAAFLLAKDTYKAIVIFILRNSQYPLPHIASLVDTIRKNPSVFPVWHNSETAKLFSPPLFENTKEAKGYWF